MYDSVQILNEITLFYKIIAIQREIFVNIFMHVLITTPSNWEMFLKDWRAGSFFCNFSDNVKIPKTSKQKIFTGHSKDFGEVFFSFQLHIHWHQFFVNIKKEKIQTVHVAGDFVQGCCFYARMQIRPVILVLFVILLSEKNRIMRNLCTSMYNFIMFVYLFVFFRHKNHFNNSYW